MAKLEFRYGNMNCGKSTLLLQIAHNYEERGMNVIILKPYTDTKGSDNIVSRLGAKRKVDYLLTPLTDIYNLVETLVQAHTYNTINCILIDESQFLKKEQVDQLMKIVIDLDVPVISFGLRNDFKTSGFEGSQRLLEISHSITELKTICLCGKKTIFNARKINGKFVFNGDQICIDDKDEVEYISLCAKCYYKEKSRGL